MSASIIDKQATSNINEVFANAKPDAISPKGNFLNGAEEITVSKGDFLRSRYSDVIKVSWVEISLEKGSSQKWVSTSRFTDQVKAEDGTVTPIIKGYKYGETSEKDVTEMVVKAGGITLVGKINAYKWNMDKGDYSDTLTEVYIYEPKS